MPILEREIDLYPENLLDRIDLGAKGDASWWAIYTLSRREKELMRQLRAAETPFYGPAVAKRYKSPAGRLRTSYIPLFANYVFIHGDETQRDEALATGCVCRCTKVVEGEELTNDLRQIRGLIESGAAIIPEARITPGNRVRVRTGAFRGYEGIVIRREGQTRLLVFVNFLQQGASILLENCELEEIGEVIARS